MRLDLSSLIMGIEEMLLWLSLLLLVVVVLVVVMVVGVRVGVELVLERGLVERVVVVVGDGLMLRVEIVGVARNCDHGRLLLVRVLWLVVVEVVRLLLLLLVVVCRPVGTRAGGRDSHPR